MWVERECRACQGAGQLRRPDPTADGGGAMDTCPVCQGAGQIYQCAAPTEQGRPCAYIIPARGSAPERCRECERRERGRECERRRQGGR